MSNEGLGFIPVISFVGRHNAGKTSLLVQVVRRLSSQGIKVAVIKHAHHGLDLPDDSDSNRLFNAGAERVVAAAPDMELRYQRLDMEQKLDNYINDTCANIDIIITEGFKELSYPKIEVLRAVISREPLQLENVIARVSDFPLPKSGITANFGLDDYDELVDFLVSFMDNIKNKANNC